MNSYITSSATFVFELFNINRYVDINFFAYLVWLLYPLILVTVILPTVIIVLLYVCACIVHLYRLRHHMSVNDILSQPHVWDRARVAVAFLWECHGWIWHGYEVHGLENIPDEGPALVVYYHGAVPVDYYYLNSRCLIYKKRLMWSVADRMLFRIPGWRLLLNVLHAFPGNVQQCAQLLRNGDIVSVSPGGVREAQFGDEYYDLVWNNRLGFAKVACLGKAPVIPVFTQNVRESFRTFPFFKDWFRRNYERTKIPLVPIYGGFPVKLRAYIGEQIPYDPSASPEQVADRTEKALRRLIQKHQRIPGSIVHALLERISG